MIVRCCNNLIKKKRFYSFDRERENNQGEQQVEGEGATGSLLSGDIDVSLDPRILGSRPEQKADA